ncbi:hypothetical protein [Saccharibacillus qingshengii]|uniref:hypothetical protein n=1 Tax=Saccharibacillus qingshengii TaxID=1763540 RepID=UPI0015575695|nr:hypothetical protein [Saccharibacillus qingshengii]
MAKNPLVDDIKEIVNEKPELTVIHNAKTKGNASVMTSPIIEKADEYYSVSEKKGAKQEERLTNFVFTNVRKVRSLGKEEALLVDIIEGKQNRKNVLLPAEIVCERRKLLPYLKKINTNIQIYAQHNKDIDLIMEHVAQQTQDIRSVVDYTGLFKHEKSKLYYYVALDHKNEVIYIQQQHANEDTTTYITGPRHLNTQMRITKSNKKTWEESGSEMLDLIPKTLKNNKSLMILAWHFASLISDWIHNELGHRLPILFVYGEKGSGKSTTLDVVSAYFGNNGKTLSMGSTPQPIRDAMSATNAFPILTTETEDKARNMQTIVPMLKELFDRSTISKGHLGGNETFHLQAPWIMQGNTQVSNEAVQDRMLQILVQKSDRNDCADAIRNSWLNKNQNKAFITGYLQHLIDNQHQWPFWFEQAKAYTGNVHGRHLSIQISMLIGMIMIQNLQKHLGVQPFSETEIQGFVKAIETSQAQNQKQEQHIQFLEFLQEYHTADEYIKKQIHQEEKGSHKFHKKPWEDEFEEYMKNSKQDINMNIIMQSLKEIGKDGSIEFVKSLKVCRKTVSGIRINPEALEKATEGYIKKENWNNTINWD